MIVKEHKLLLGTTALLSIGSVVAGCATSGGTIALIPALAKFAESSLGGMAATNIGDLAKKLRDSSQVLTNEELPKAAAKAIALGIQTVAKHDAYRDIAHVLTSLANSTEKYWLQVERSEESPGDYTAIRKDQLRYAFAANSGEGDRLETLDVATGKKLVTWLMEQHRQHLPADITEYQDAIDAISQHLYQRFAYNLREVLKQDASEGGQAFSGMVLDLLRDNITQTKQGDQQLKITQQEIINILQQMDIGIQDELAHIRQTLQQYLDLTKPQLPIPQECETQIKDKTKDFVGREYVFKAIREFLQQQSKGYFILEADPGVGKSAIMARCVQLFNGRCLTHFNIRSQGIIRADQFLENICTQLIEGYSLNYSSGLPKNTTRDGNVLARLLGEASKTLARGQKLVVVVDALDEVDLFSQTPFSNVLYLPDALPDNVYFILSKRPKQLSLPQSDNLTLFDLMHYPAESARDARSYVEKRWQQTPKIQQWVTARNSTPEKFLTELVARSENNFMYLRYVLNDIRDGLYQSETLDSLPTGLRQYYQKHWQIMGMNATPLPRDKIRTIYVLSEVREAVSPRLLAQMTEVAEYILRPFLKEWEQFLRLERIERETRYSIYHASFSDFLNEEAQDSGVDLEEINRRIAKKLADGAPL